MSYKQLPSGYFVSDRVPGIAFHKKPPDWIEEYLYRVYLQGQEVALGSVKRKARDFLEELGVFDNDL